MYNLLKKQRIFLIISLACEFVGIGILALLVALHPSYNNYPTIALILMGLFCLYDGVTIFCFNYAIQKKKGKTEVSSAEIIGNDIDEAYRFGGVGLAVIDVNGVVMWVNKFMATCFPDIVDKVLVKAIPEVGKLLEDHSDDKDDTKTSALEVINADNHFFSVEYLKDARLFIFKDIQDKQTLKNDNMNQRPVVGYISIDNYYDVQIQVSDDSKFNEALLQVRDIISNFGLKYKALLRSVKDDRYIFVTTYEYFTKMYDDKFRIVDSVRNVMPDGFTLSIGISYGFPEFAKLTELASSALDVALSRGGDQTVVFPFSNEMIYIGGKTELKPSRNRVKIRTMSNSFLTTLKNYKQVIIMGHKMADFDAIGSALGVFLLCQHAKVNAHVVYEEQEVEANCRIAIESNYDRKVDFNKVFCSAKTAESLLDDEALLVCVDHNNPQLSMVSSLLEQAKHIAVIDHHRPGQTVIDAQVFNNIDTSASSASEILTSYITYNPDNIFIDQRTATFLLAGITLDTHNFKDKATNSTFEAASTLKSYNADSAKVDDFLKEDYEEYKQKILILNNSEIPKTGVLVCQAPEDIENLSDVMLSLVADDAIQIRGIQCSFAYGVIQVNDSGEKTIKISARSDGSINCGVLMEKLGGGGHFAMAASKITGLSLDEVKAKIYKVLDDYLDDARASSPQDKEK